MPIVVFPGLIVVANPAVAASLLIVATFANDEVQCPVWVTILRACRQCKFRWRVNCCGTPEGTFADCGLITIDTSCATVTVTRVDPETEPEAALMFAAPAVTPVTNPFFTVATGFVSEDQVAEAVRSCVLPSVNVPVAVNCWVVPATREGFAGVTAIETKVAAVTVRVVVPLIEPEVAVMLAVPAPTAVAKP